jgi:DNA polymerase IV
MERIILHLDMDAFFASVEQSDNPDLKGKPVLIGQGNRGVISAASYEARVFGVHSAMPVLEAKRKCPDGIFLKGRMSRYKEVSKHVMEILCTFSPLVEQASIDEAYLDISGSQQLFGSPETLSILLKQAVKDATNLNCSVGVAPNKYLAKIVSDWRKPDGIYILEPEDVPEFMLHLPVKKIPGVGKKFQEELALYNIMYAGDILGYSSMWMEERFGKRGGDLFNRAKGIDNSPVKPNREMKSTSCENTFSEDISDKRELKKWLMNQSERVGTDLRRNNFLAKTISLKMKYSDFVSISRSHTLTDATNSTKLIYKITTKMLMGISLRKAVRLIGVGASNLQRENKQLTLFETQDQKENKLDNALDAIRKKHGKSVIKRGPSMEK